MRLLDYRKRETPDAAGSAIKHAPLRLDPGGFPIRRLDETPTVTVEDMREIQRIAMDEFSFDILQLTENAGRSLAELVLAMFGGKGRGQRVIVLAGTGNNGAAGLVSVRHLANWGFNVEPIMGGIEEQLSPTTRRQADIVRAASGREYHDHDHSEDSLREHLIYADLIVDALVGYGADGPPSGPAAAVAELANESGRPILALDVPSGVSARSGVMSSPCLRATTTLVLDLPKRGMLEPSCSSAVGELFLADIGIPRAVHERKNIRLNGLYSEGPIVRLRR